MCRLRTILVRVIILLQTIVFYGLFVYVFDAGASVGLFDFLPDNNTTIHGWFYPLCLLTMIGTGLTIVCFCVILRNSRLRSDVEAAFHRATKGRYKHLVEPLQNKFFLYSYGTDGHLTRVSPWVTHILGYPAAEFLGEFFDYFSGDGINQYAISCMHSSIKGERQKPFEAKLKHRDGGTRWFEMTEVPIFDRNGRVLAVEGIAIDITHHKEKELSLAENEDRYRTFIAQSFEGIWRYEFKKPVPIDLPEGEQAGLLLSDSVLTEANTIYAEMCGYMSLDEMIGTSISERFTDPEEGARMVTGFIRSGYRFERLEVLREISKGYSKWFLESVFGRVENNQLTDMWGIQTDITKLKAAEQAIRDKESLYRSVLNSMNAQIAVLDKSGNITTVNQLWEQTAREKNATDPVAFGTGFNYIDVCQKSLTSGNGNVETVIRGITAVLTGESRRFFCEYNIQYNGSEQWYGLYVTPLPEHMGGCVVAHIDISDRKHAEKSLEESRQFIKAVTQALPNVIYVVDVDKQTLVYSNYPIAESLGYLPGEITDTVSFFSRKILHAEDLDAIGQLPERWSRAMDGDVLETEFRLRDVNGNWQWFLSRDKVYRREDDGRVKEIIGTAHNISELKHAQKKIKMHQEQLIHADKMVALGTLVAGVAHEINNPNTFIMSGATQIRVMWKELVPILDEWRTMTEDSGIGHWEYHEFCDRLVKLVDGLTEGSKRIKRIVADLKQFARKDDSGTLVPVDMNQVVSVSLSLISNLLKHSTRCLSVELSQNLPAILGNENRLEQVLVNLIMNACQALEDVDKSIRVTTVWDRNDNIVKVMIQDEGHGIPKEKVKQISDPFFTTKRDKGGLGLGLSITSRIVDDHNGTMVFESAVGKGTLVTLNFPVINNTGQNL